MADNSGNMQHFWGKSEQYLQTFSSDFNFQMSQKGFQLEYLIVDRNPIGFGYPLRMKYKKVIVQPWDYLIPSMDTKQEIVTNIKEMLRNIQTIALKYIL